MSLGISLVFGLLDIANIAQPAFLILGAYATYVVNSSFGLDPIVTGILFTPLFYVLGAVVYRVYYAAFERRGDEALRGLVFFFGLLFIMEVSLSLKYGVDYRLVEAPYIGKSIELGVVGIAYRLLVPCVVGLAMTGALYLFQEAQRRNPNLGEASYAIERVQAALNPPPAPAEPEAEAPPPEQTHTVESGDTLSAIAERYYGDANQWSTIFEANRDQLDNPDLIQPGQVLRIPS